MITIKTLSENYNEVLEELKETLEDAYIGDLDDYNHAQYGCEAVAVYQDDVLLDMKIYDPFHKFSTGVYIDSDGWSHWLCCYCDDEDIMSEGGLSDDEIKEILSL